ncbi:uncharacterized protein PHALS_10436 [Plasmopara halstedii]|uniref:Uncharacterized protein n=1 Tax=Plasmopara halstedii TaxID=4781 RepID=A0A0P1AHN4_PLAHL|nr:uncharacterized protein PHALS_10436 [Plasmopara halstedii]CEG40224.1 hypothetical protein PHALS_10436 [Plasmopara halstedii]|eukprot:XP_024576593.1 hypothetical protein PHALS_10436 [Plasmopara halstedii]
MTVNTICTARGKIDLVAQGVGTPVAKSPRLVTLLQRAFAMFGKSFPEEVALVNPRSSGQAIAASVSVTVSKYFPGDN